MQFYIYQLQRELPFSFLLLLFFYLSSAAPHSFCSLAFDTSPPVSVPPAQRRREVPETIPYILRRPSVAHISVLCPGLCCYHLLSGGLDGVTVGYEPWLLTGLNLSPKFSLLYSSLVLHNSGSLSSCRTGALV